VIETSSFLNSQWPILRSYTEDSLQKIALPLGGIGTGTVSLGGRGDLRDWEIMSRPAKGFSPANSFFALYVKQEGSGSVAKALEGPIPETEYEGATGARVPNHGLPRFQKASFHAAYPLAQVALDDPAVPVKVRLEGFNPFIPADVPSSSLPVASLRYVVANPTDQPVDVAICGSVANFLGEDSRGVERENRFVESDTAKGLLFEPGQGDRNAEAQGTMTLSAIPPSGAEVTRRSNWMGVDGRAWGAPLLDFWQDFSEDGRLEERKRHSADSMPMGSLAVSAVIPPGAVREFAFVLGWHFPNREAWAVPVGSTDPRKNVGNHYATLFKDSWDAVRQAAPKLPELETRTARFVRDFAKTDCPEILKEAALFNLSTLRSQTLFRAADGHFFGWEGCHDTQGCCPGSCTHVWNYEQATPFLFGDMSRDFREVEYLYATEDSGRMNFRVGLPPEERGHAFGTAAADGQLGCLMKLYRDWQLSGDDAFLNKLWPKAKKSMEFCWIAGGWDADQDGVMEGCQHNTMDVEYFGPNPQMSFWYLGALRCMEKMAAHLGENDFSDLCRDLFERGSGWIAENLFNGEYFEHEIRPSKATEIAPGLRREEIGVARPDQPDLQLGNGCLVDQLIGQLFANVCDLGYLVKPEQVRSALGSIHRHNTRRRFFDHFNPMRSYALGNETALLMCSFPKGQRERRPFPYFGEVMTGYEYTAAVHMIYEGMEEEGLQHIADIRERYDGRRRNPFNEAECGHHYSRAMIAWTSAVAWTRFHYSAVEKSIFVGERPGRYFFSTGYAWGSYTLEIDGDQCRLSLVPSEGDFSLLRCEVKGFAPSVLESERRVTPNAPLVISFSRRSE